MILLLWSEDFSPIEVPLAASLLLIVCAKTLVKKVAKQSKECQADYQNKGPKELSVLHAGDRVRLKLAMKSQSSWSGVTVMRRLNEWSYEIDRDSGLTLRHNRVYLHTSREADADKPTPDKLPVKVPAPKIPVVTPPSPRKPPDQGF